MPNLKSLGVGTTTASPISDEGLRHLAKHAGLESLKISGLGITGAGIDHIAKLTNLNELALYWAGPYKQGNLTDESLTKLAALKSLEHLVLPNNGTFTLSAVSQLNNLPSLKWLEVSGIVQDGSGLDLSKLTSLTYLDLKMAKGDTLRDEDLSTISKLKRLEHLRLYPWSSSTISDAGLAHLADLPSLEMLDVGGLNITDDGMRHLGKLKTIYRLRVAGDINDAGLRHLEANKHLRSISVRTTGAISPSAHERIRKKPNKSRLKVEQYPTNW